MPSCRRACRRGQSGPRLVAFVALLDGLLPPEQAADGAVPDLDPEQPCCPALTVKHQSIATQALRPAYEELVRRCPRSRS